MYEKPVSVSCFAHTSPLSRALSAGSDGDGDDLSTDNHFAGAPAYLD
jgi:hypothetical protein